MSAHRLDRRARTARRPRRSGRLRALLALAAVVVVCAGLSVHGTFAFWTDSASLQTGSFTTGTLDITLDGQLSGTGGTYQETAFKLDNLVPGESIAYSFPIKNTGSVGVTYNVSGTGTGGLATANGLQYSVAFGATAANSGTTAAGTRAGTCGGTAATDANTTALTSTASSFAAGRALPVGQSDTVCIVARLSGVAPNALQGLSGSASFVFDSKQVGA